MTVVHVITHDDFPHYVQVEGSAEHASILSDADLERIAQRVVAMLRELAPQVGVEVPIPVWTMTAVEASELDRSWENFKKENAAMKETSRDKGGASTDVGSRPTNADS